MNSAVSIVKQPGTPERLAITVVSHGGSGAELSIKRKCRIKRMDIKLDSGRLCRLLRIKADLIPNYYLLAFPKEYGEPSAGEVAEMLTLGIEQAQ